MYGDDEIEKDDRASQQLVPLPSPSASPLPSAQIKSEYASASRYRDRSRSDNTIRSYESSLKTFFDYCDERSLEAIPATPLTVVTYLAWLADEEKKASTIGIHLSAINWKHKKEGYPLPSSFDGHKLIEDVMAGIRRTQKLIRKNRKRPVQAEHVLAMIETISGEDTRAHRDRAILAFGLASAMRRSELVALNLEDISFVNRGIRVQIRSSKGDQEGDGEQISIPNGKIIRPVHHLKAWLDMRGADEGPLFCRFDQAGNLTNLPMSDRAIARLVKQYALAADLNPNDVAAHSMRSGFLTDAAERRASITKMQEVSRHKTVDILASYVRSAEQLDDHAGEDFL